MSIKDILTEKRSVILGRWFDSIVDGYPADTAKFIKGQKDRFANPVGSTILKGIEDIFDEILAGGDKERVSEFLDNVVRIRAVQDFTPSESVSFIFLLKKIIREELKSGQYEPDELVSFEAEIDSLALLSFDIFMKCRERLFEVKMNEFRNMTNRLLRMADLVSEVKDEDFKEDLNILKAQRKEVTK